jgi:hypothetical protein
VPVGQESSTRGIGACDTAVLVIKVKVMKNSRRNMTVPLYGSSIMGYGLKCTYGLFCVAEAYVGKCLVVFLGESLVVDISNKLINTRRLKVTRMRCRACFKAMNSGCTFPGRSLHRRTIRILTMRLPVSCWSLECRGEQNWNIG